MYLVFLANIKKIVAVPKFTLNALSKSVYTAFAGTMGTVPNEILSLMSSILCISRHFDQYDITSDINNQIS